jgi:hypothetical protein
MITCFPIFLRSAIQCYSILDFQLYVEQSSLQIKFIRQKVII